MFFNVLSLFSSFIHFVLGLSTPQSYPPPLSEDAERDLFLVLEKGAPSAKDAREKLILHNLRLVSHIVRKYYATANNQEDLVSIGTIGLIKAINTFRADRNIKLDTYASRCIENEILMTLRASRKRQGEVSLQDPVGTDGEGNDVTYMDILGTEPDEVENTVIRQVTLSRVHEVLSSLPARERLVLEMRYGLLDGKQHPQHEVAKVLGISRSYV